MKSIVRVSTLAAATLLVAAAAFLMKANSFSLQSDGVTVHEWGTFTSIADESGGAEPWSPLAGPSDLPCFVTHLHGLSFKSAGQPAGWPTTNIVTVRMETPVLYFYSPRKTTVSVHVDFPRGLITEWYPRANETSPAMDSFEANLALFPPVRDGRIEWDNVEITPGETPAIPKGAGASHYYAARNTDSAPIRIGDQYEKMIFYRGVADFSGPLRARMTGEGKVELSADHGPLPPAILFENRGGKAGYRVIYKLDRPIQLDEPDLSADPSGIKQELASRLVEMGLFPKEADAMVATWSDSWFEEGLRVFYLVPRDFVDAVLPLTIKPSPVALQRVFVGRVELLSPVMRKDLETALTAGDTKTLDKFGRFLEPFMKQVNASHAPSVGNYLQAKAIDAQREFYAPSCVP